MTRYVHAEWPRVGDTWAGGDRATALAAVLELAAHVATLAEEARGHVADAAAGRGGAADALHAGRILLRDAELALAEATRAAHYATDAARWAAYYSRGVRVRAGGAA